jgi:hypothetical protein
VAELGQPGSASRSQPERQRKALESATREGESPVRDAAPARGSLFLSTTGHAKSCGKLGGPPSKANYLWPPIANEYREGKVKSTPQGE